jgi:cell division septation protein DedD
MSPKGKGGGDFILESRHLVGLFMLLVVIFGVVFTLGYLMGRSQYDPKFRASIGRSTEEDPPAASASYAGKSKGKPERQEPAVGASWSPPKPGAGSTLSQPKTDRGITASLPKSGVGNTGNPAVTSGGATGSSVKPGAGSTWSLPKKDAASAGNSAKTGPGPVGNSPKKSDWDFYRSAEAKTTEDHLQPEKKPVAPPESDAPKPAAVPAKPAAPSKSSAPAGTPLVASGAIMLQVAAVQRESDALALAQALQQKKFPAYVITPGPDKYYRVQVGPYADTQSATTARHDLEARGFKSIVKR